MSALLERVTGGKNASPQRKWIVLGVLIVVALIVLALLVLLAKWLRELPGVQSFMSTYPGTSELPDNAPVGIPPWLAWQHFLNALLIVMIVRTGWLVRTTQRPKAFWTRKNTGVLRTKNPPTKISMDLWLHQSLDVVWVLNGLVFYILLFVTGQWMRVVPTSWDIFPNALSALLQYASLSWPVEHGWVNYNALQVLSYFAVIFLAAPLAIITGIRMSGAWPKNAERLNRVYPMELARAIHFPTMIFFVLFIIVHVTLVLTTGALRNLNTMYAAQDSEESWLGFWFFAASIVVTAALWVFARPAFLAPVASLTGKVSSR